MKMTLKYLACAFAFAGLLVAGIVGAQQMDQDNIRSQQGTAVDVTQPAPSGLPAGLALKENARTAAVEEAIRNVLSTATGAVLSGDTNKLIEQLSHPDRERLQAETNFDWNPLRQTVGVFTKAWDEVYDIAGDLTSDDLAGTNMTVTVGEIADPAALTNWPLDPIRGMQGVSGTQEPSVSRGPVGTLWSGAARSAAGVINRDYMAEGRDVAVAVLPKAGNIPELTISLTHEAVDFWKIDIPDNMDLATLQRNLSDQISRFANESSSWPPDQNETERLLARRVLMALYDVGATGTQGSTTSSGTGTSSPDMD